MQRVDLPKCCLYVFTLLTGVPLVDDMDGVGESIVSSNTIFHSAQYPSRIILPLVSKAQLPEVNVVKAFEDTFATTYSSYGLTLEDIVAKYERMTAWLLERY
jgi:hypothetical protein